MILGVTGGIATGKSSVADLFRAQKVPVVSADDLAREVVLPGTGTLCDLVATFGTDILSADGSLDRERLSQIIFADDVARGELNQIVHPAIAELAESTLARLVNAGAEFIVYEAPLLYEAGAESRVDKVLVVTVSPVEQKKRLMARDGVDAATADLRIAAQMPIDEKIRRADFVIDNSGTPDDTARQVMDLCRELKISINF
jgi:dephospho-CoA kinase